MIGKTQQVLIALQQLPPCGLMVSDLCRGEALAAHT
jgi:hypothetical protein